MLRILFFLLISLNIVNAQNTELVYKHLNTKDGLPSNTIYYVTQDNEGYIWFGTDAGICMFDGLNYITYTVQNGLPSNEVFEILPDKKNRIWLRTYSNQICYIKNKKIYTSKNDSLLAKINLTQRVSNIMEDDVGNIIIIEGNSKFHIIGKKTIEEMKIYGKSSIENKAEVLDVLKSQCLKNSIVFLSANFVTYNRVDKFKISPPKPITNRKILSDFYIEGEVAFCLIDGEIIRLNTDSLINNKYEQAYVIGKPSKYIFPVAKRYLAVITNNEVQFYNKNTNLIEKKVLANQAISEIYEDKNNNIYFSSLKNGIFIVRNFNSQAFKIANLGAKSILKTQKELLIGNNNYELISLNSASQFIEIHKKENAIEGQRVLQVDSTINGNYLVVTDADFLKIDANLKFVKSSKNPKYNLGSCKDFLTFQNKIYLNTHIGTYRFNNNLQIEKIIINPGSQAIQAFQNVIYSTSLNRIYYIANDTLQLLSTSNPIKSRIVQLVALPNKLLIVTAEDGLYAYANNKIEPYLTNNLRLSSNNCNKVFVYKNQLYVATKKGVNIINAEANKIKYLYEPDGLASNNVNDLSVYNDTLYAATDAGVSLIDLQNLPTNKIDAYFINPTIIGKDTLWDNNITTTHNDVPVKFVLNSISIATDGKLIHYYRIKELDTTWAFTENKFIDIQNLNPGEYTLETYVENSYNTKSAIISKKIIVQPYFMQRKLVHVLLALIGALLLFALYKKRVALQLAKQKEKQDVQIKFAALELSSWRAKINPHFIFNAFNAMQSIFITKNFELANTYLANFSRVLRRTINHSGEILTSISNEVSYIESYLTLEKIKRNELLQYTISIEPQEVESLFIPSMLLQPIIENALKHGIKENNNGLITISFWQANNCTYCRITDNGVGYSATNQGTNASRGMQLIQEKINIIQRLINDRILFESQNYFDKSKNILGVETIFTFPKLTKNIDLHDSNNN